MSSSQALLTAAIAALALYAAFVAALVIAGRRQDARRAGRLHPRLHRPLSPPAARRARPAPAQAAASRADRLPRDAVRPGARLHPVAGQLDDAIIVALVLRSVLRAGDPDLLHEHWPGPQASLNALTRLAYGRAA